MAMTDRDRARTVTGTLLLLAATAWLLALLFGGLHFYADVGGQHVNVRWAPSVTAADRPKLEQALGLVQGERDAERTWRYLPSDRSRANLSRLVHHPLVEDTDHIDHAAFRVQLDRPDLPPWLVALAETGHLDTVAWFFVLAGLVPAWFCRRAIGEAAGPVIIRWAAAVRSRVSILGEPATRVIRRLIAHSVWVFFLLFSYQYFLEIKGGGDLWKTGDWLINYSQGPVRRGLIGTLLLDLADLGLTLKWVVYGVQVAFYAMAFGLVITIYNLRQRAWGWIGVLFSPAFLLFPFHDYDGGFRKEIIVFVPVAWLCLAYAKQRLTQAHLLVISGLFVVAVFSHELAALTLPFFVYVFYQLWKARVMTAATAIACVASYAIVSIGALLFAYVFNGDARLAASLCDSLTQRGLSQNICSGAIAWLDKDTSYGFRTFNINLPKYSLLYASLFVLSVIPVWFVSWKGRERLYLLCGSFLFLLPLCFVAIDWGRWIHIYVFCLFCVVLAESVWQDVEVMKVPVVLVLLYVTTWSIPHCCSYEFGRGLIGEAYNYLAQ